MAFDLVLRNAHIVTPEGVIEGDVALEGGRIAAIGEVNGKAERERDCSGLYILPGLIDIHVHLRDPGWPMKEDFGSGTRAAAAGGVTTVLDMPNTNPLVTTQEILDTKRAAAASKSLVNFGLYMALTDDNIDDIKRATNFIGVKVYLAKTTGDMFVKNMKALEELFEMDKLVLVHAEDEEMIEANALRMRENKDPSVHSLIRPPEAAYESVKTVLHLAKKKEARVHITHASTALEVNELAKFSSPLITADATPHHLFLNDTSYKKLGTMVKVNPPLRSEADRKALWTALREGTLTAIATDHAPHTVEEKSAPYMSAPAGVPGLETMLPLLLDAVNHNELTLAEVVRLTSERPAQIARIPNKGRIEVGHDADLVVVDMNDLRAVGARGFATRCGWSPFTGKKLKGWPVMTIVGGTIVYGNGLFNESFRGKEIVAAPQM